MIIRRKGDGLAVVVFDGYDSERPDVYDLNWKPEKQELSFAALWSSGRFVKYRFSSCLAKDRLELTFTFIDQEQWERA